MGIVLDTDVIIRGERGNFDLDGFLATCGDSPVRIAAVTVAELLHGLERASPSRRPVRESYLTSILATVSSLPYSDLTARIHARIWARLAGAGVIIGAYDMIIAATCIEHGLELATFNVRHFERIEGLRLVEVSA